MFAFLLYFLLPLSAICDILRVPQEYGTIQTALDSVQAGDTILVAVGVYNESLDAPSVNFTLLGDAIPDTGDYPRPVIDPSPLPESNSLACLTLHGSSVGISHVVFRNGPQMYPRIPPYIGGIWNDSDTLRISNCLFDSTYRSIARNNGHLDARNCVFRNSQASCISRSGAALHSARIISCSFLWRGDLAVWAGDSTIIEDCIFYENQGGSEMLWLQGTGITVRNCIFGGSDLTHHTLIWSDNLRGCVFEGNCICGFTRLQHASIELHIDCDQNSITYIRDNTFENNVTTPGYQGCMGIVVQCGSEFGNTAPVFIENNSFQHLVAGRADASLLYSGASFQNNFFEQDNSPGIPTVLNFQAENTVLRNNFFQNTSFAIREEGGVPLDAVENWWGHPSGPYHSVGNPNGLGDTLIGNILFSPWLTDTISDLPENSNAGFPTDFQLTVYPNPFNASATIRLIVSAPADIRVEILNLLGQKVYSQDIKNAIPENHIRFDASALTSGIYFVRAHALNNPQLSTLSKIVLLK